MNDYVAKTVFGIIILISALLFGFIPVLFFNKKFKKSKVIRTIIDYSEAFACGVFLGAGLLGLLFQANKSFVAAGISNYGYAFLITGLVFLLLLLIEHLSNNHVKRKSITAINNTKTKNKITKQTSLLPVTITVISLSIHSFIIGVGMGVTNAVIIYLLFIGIIIHKMAVSFSISLELNKTHLSKSTISLIIVLFSIMTPAGIVIGSLINVGNTDILFAVFAAISAGTFIYIGTLHGLYNSILIKKCCDIKAYTLTIVGFSVIAGISAIN